MKRFVLLGVLATACASSKTEAPVVAGAAPVAIDVPESAKATGTGADAFNQGVQQLGNDRKAALASFRKAAKENPKLAAAHYNIAAILAADGDREGAKRAYEKALEADPAYGPAVAGLASQRDAQGDNAGAIQLLKNHVADHTESAIARAQLAQLLARNNELDAARDHAIAALHLDERSAEAMLALGMVYRRQHKIELAQLALEQALAVDPGLGEAYNELGLVYVALDQKAKAVAAFERAAGATPRVAAVQNNLGAMRNEVGAYELAAEAINKAIALDTKQPRYYLNLGNALRGQQKYAEAEAAYRQAVALGDSPEALFNLGVLYLDNEIAGKDTVTRYRECVAFLTDYLKKAKPTAEETREVSEYVLTANKAIEAEERRIERDKKREQQKEAK